jgi:hypothetical protein
LRWTATEASNGQCCNAAVGCLMAQYLP